MDAEQRIIKLLKDKKESGILQSEIPSLLNISKSTVSETISKLEEDGIVVRKKVTSKSYRVWLAEHSPEPVEGLIRVGILKASEYPKIVRATRKAGGIVRVYNSGLEATKALSSGYIDVAASPLVTQAFFGVLLKNIKIYRIVAMNGSGVVFSNFESQYFGCSEFSTMERNLRKYMETKNLKARIRYFSSADEMVESLKELKGVAIWEPYLTLLEGYKRELFNEVFGDFVCCTLAANNNFVEMNKDIFDRFLDNFDSAKVYTEDANSIAELIGFDSEIVKKSFSNYIFDVEQDISLIEKELEFIKLGSLSSILRL